MGRVCVTFSEIAVEEVEERVDDELLLMRGQVPVVPTLGKGDVANLT